MIVLAAVLAWFCIPASVLTAGEEPSTLELRRIVNGEPEAEGVPIPRNAIRVFTYEGAAKEIEVDDQFITVDYGRTGCVFDRDTGELVRRRTVAGGWSESEPPKPPAWPEWDTPTGPIGPGVVPPETKKDVAAGNVVAASIEFRGETWRAMQPRWRLHGMAPRTSPFKGWTHILETLNGASFVEAEGRSGRPPRRYTTFDGLASNIVSGFAVFENTLYAVCADICDREKDEWGPGGLCRFSPAQDRWTRVEIEREPVRFVTMIQPIGDELWIGFREGSGVEGDELLFGMGAHLREYRPEITAVSVARLKDDEWRIWSRPPCDPTHGSVPRANRSQTPTERPVKVLPGGRIAFLFSDVRQWGPYRPGGYKRGFISRVNLETGEWTTWDSERIFGTPWVWGLAEMNGEFLATSNRGVHQYDQVDNTWRFLDPQPMLKSPVFGPIQPVGDEVWFAYGNAHPTVPAEDGIIRYNERTGDWTRMSLGDLRSGRPPKKMILLPGGDLWVVFHPHPDLTPALSGWIFSYMPWRLSTVGRYSDGEWEFPVPLPGVTTTYRDEPQRSGLRSGTFQTSNGPVTSAATYRIKELILLGDRLYLCTGHEVFEGPDPWREIFSVPESEGDWDRCHFPLTIAGSENGERLIITRREERPPHRVETLSRAEYTPGDSKIEFETVPVKQASSVRKSPDPAPKKPAKFPNRWVKDSVEMEGGRVELPFEGYRRVLETPWAVWVIIGGELIRLDRAKISAWLGTLDGRN